MSIHACEVVPEVVAVVVSVDEPDVELVEVPVVDPDVEPEVVPEVVPVVVPVVVGEVVPVVEQSSCVGHRLSTTLPTRSANSGVKPS